LAFITFLNEKRSREMFLFMALGMSRQQVFGSWIKVVVAIWAISCLLSLLFVQVFNYALAEVSLFQLPGDVYYLGKLGLKIGWQEYAIVFSVALGWVLILSLGGLIRIRRRSLLHGLRKEFS
jgi:ABC-type antimicrobial peptide transport system permease subunit